MLTHQFGVATVLTVYGIETLLRGLYCLIQDDGLQQCLPFTVLKPNSYCIRSNNLTCKLQQCLPFTVCAEGCETAEEQSDDEVHTSQVPERSEGKTKMISNSTYRLRYAPKGARQQRSKATMKSAHLKCLSEARVKQR